MVAKVEKAPIYTYLFDKKSGVWGKDAEANKFFLLRQQEYANEKLKAKGHLFLNEVLDILGLPITKVGQVVGWVYDENNRFTDNWVDFGIFRLPRRRGVDGAIVLNFNVDGNILDRI